jgi:hypothetical protein
MNIEGAGRLRPALFFLPKRIAFLAARLPPFFTGNLSVDTAGILY